MNGVLNLLKPPGMSSSDAVVRVRRTLSGEKVGHAGTLDPEAAGILPLLVGKAVRLSAYCLSKEKDYLAEIALGMSTDTQDATGIVTQTGIWDGDWDRIRAVLPRFLGDIDQLPPQYSALKIGGQTAYQIARGGGVAELATRRVRVSELRLQEITGQNTAFLKIHCGAGTYVRTLCHDIGEVIGCPAHMRFLLRTQVGAFSLDDAITLEMWASSDNRAALLSPMAMAVSHVPTIHLPLEYHAECKFGRKIMNIEAPQGALSVFCGHTFVGVAHLNEGVLCWDAMLMTGEESP